MEEKINNNADVIVVGRSFEAVSCTPPPFVAVSTTNSSLNAICPICGEEINIPEKDKEDAEYFCSQSKLWFRKKDVQ